MCLKTTNTKRKVAKKDITVFKILRKRTDKATNKVDYEPPYRGWGRFFYREGVNSAEYESEEINVLLNMGCAIVEGGFLHAYVDVDYALDIMRNSFENNNTVDYYFEYELYKMVIPKGTEYFVGSNNDVCAKKLIWEDMLPCATNL